MTINHRELSERAWHIFAGVLSALADMVVIASLAARSFRVFCCRPTAGNALAQGLFTVGVYFAVTFGSLIVGRLMTEQRISDARFPTLALPMVPHATASTAWFGLNDNRITTFGIGLAAVLAMMALIQLFILPDYLRRPLTISCWSFSFPLASVANTEGH